MSFRLRALGLIMLVAIVAAGATAMLSLAQATRAVRKTVVAGQQEIAMVRQEILRHGTDHASWAGIDRVVQALAGRTGKRIRVVTESGTPLADSEDLAGNASRPITEAPVLVDPRPTLQLPDGVIDSLRIRTVILALSQYRTAVAYGRCLTGAGVEVTMTPGENGMPVAHAGAGPTSTCAPAAPAEADVHDDSAAATGCAKQSGAGLADCLEQVFIERSRTFAPEIVRVYVGTAGNAPAPQLPKGPALLAALLVATMSIVVALLLSRGVLRPVRGLITAAGRLGSGDLSQRVPVSGRDEIASLARSFNRMADSLQASEDRQRQMTGDIAHELRTPLANLRGYLEAMRDGVVEPTQDLLESLHEEALLQQRIVDDLRDLALAEVGALQYQPAAVDLGELVLGCAVANRGSAESAGIDLTAAPCHGVVVEGDADRLRQVIGNLVTNAIRATAPGGSVRLSLAAGGGHVQIMVRDTGAGIAADHLPHVFDRFWRADTARARSTGGSGLGLAIARQIVMDHRGTITVQSVRGVGTTFTVTLPTSQDHNSQAAAA